MDGLLYRTNLSDRHTIASRSAKSHSRRQVKITAQAQVDFTRFLTELADEPGCDVSSATLAGIILSRSPCRSGPMSPTRKITQLAEPGDGHRRYASSSDKIDDRACPGRGHVPCVDLVQRNEPNNPEARG